MNIPTVQIRTQPAKLAIQTSPSKLEIEQPKPTFELSTKAAYVEFQSPRGQLIIDQSKAWHALAIGNHFDTMRSIYAEVENIVLSTIARIASEGDQLAAIHTKTNAIANIAASRGVDKFELAFAGTATYDNVDIHYTEREVEYQPVPSEFNLYAEQNSPRIQYVGGNIDITVAQHSTIEMIPPQIDLQV